MKQGVFAMCGRGEVFHVERLQGQHANARADDIHHHESAFRECGIMLFERRDDHRPDVFRQHRSAAICSTLGPEACESASKVVKSKS